MISDEKLDTSGLRLSSAVRFEVKADATGEIAGLASPFDAAPDAYGDVVAPGAFAASLAEHRKRGTAPALLWSHDPARPIGRWFDLKETREGLEVRGVLNLKTDAGREAYEHVRAGDVNGLSIGFRVPSGGTTRDASGLRRLTRVDLVEISVVALPAAATARLREVKQIGSRAELRDLLHAAGLSRGAAEKVASAGWPALAATDPQAQALGNLAGRIKAVAAAYGRKS